MKYPVTHPMKVSDLVEQLAGLVQDTYGSAHQDITYVCNLMSLDGRDALAFCSLEADAAIAAIEQSRAAAVICNGNAAIKLKASVSNRTLIVSNDPRAAFAVAAQHLFNPAAPEQVRHPLARIASSAQIGDGVSIGANAVIGENCVIHAGSRIEPGAVVYQGTEIGHECRIEAGAVLGSKGFGFARDSTGTLVRFPQLGKVVLGDRVEIGSRASVDCGSLQDTEIGCGTKVDDLAYIAHNVSIGRDCLIMAGAVLCGGCRIGDFVEIAPGAVVREKITIGARARIGLGSVVTKDVPAGVSVAGVPARPL